MSTLPATATELLDAYRRRELDPVDVVDEHLARIEATEPAINAFRTVDGDGARAAAREAARRWERGEPAGELGGVPVSIKDIVSVKGWATSEGSATVDLVPAGEDSPPVARLREAGAVLLGQTTTPEFGWKGMTDSPLTGVTRNPWDLDRTPGGSSGGAGASLAAGVGALAFGNDGGGSIRIPASYCGLVGLKPSFGRVPHHPIDSPYATLVAGGPLARSVADAALMLGVLARPDSRDWYSLPHDGRDWRSGLDEGVGGLRIAVSTDLGGARPDAAVVAAVETAAGWLDDAGATVEVVGPVFEPVRPQFEDYWKAGFAARLRSIPEDRHDLLDPGFRALATEGLDVGLEQYYAAVGARTRLAARMRAFHERHDLLVTPTMPTLPPTVETVYHSPGFDRWEHAVPFTVPFNLTGQPAASMPCGLSSEGLPIGVQLVATHHREDLVLRAMQVVETAWPVSVPHTFQRL